MRIETGHAGMDLISYSNVVESAPPPPLRQEPPSGGLDIKALTRRLLRGLPVIVVFAVLGVVLGGVLMRILPLSYTSSVSVLIDPKMPGAMGAEAEFANIYVDASKIASVEVVLLSSSLLQRVVEAEHLADDPNFGGASHSMIDRYLPFLSAKHEAAPDTPTAREARAVDKLRRMIRTTRIGVTYVIKIDIAASTAARAQGLAQAVADAYLTDQVTTKLDAARRDSAWLSDRLTQQRSELIRSEVAVESIRKKLGVLSGGTNPDSSVDRQAVSQVNDELVKAEADVAASGARYQQAQHVLHGGGNIEGLPDIAASKVIQDLRHEQEAASRRLAEISTRYAADHPLRRQAEDERASVNSQVSLEVSRVLGSLQNDYFTAIARRDALQKQLTHLVGMVNAAANAEGRVELREAERVAEANRISYEASLAKLRELEQQQTRQDVEARIISAPELPERPSFPKAMIMLPGGGAFGLMLGVGAVLAWPRGRRQVEDADEAERDLLLPVLAMTPFLRHRTLLDGGRVLTIPEYLASNPFSGYAESLRLLRLRLRTHKIEGGQVVQVTSALPGEGKSTIAASLAISAASAGMRTVLVDLDLHQPAAGRLLGHGVEQGVVDILMGDTGAEAALCTHASLPLRIISAGSISALNPSMIESTKLRELVSALSRDFDMVVLDTPPVLAICDPLYISGLVDKTILVVAWRATPQGCVDDALARLRAAHAPLAGMLINKVQPGKSDPYGTYRYGRGSYVPA